MANPFSNLNDKELMILYQSGDNMAFEVIYSRHKNKIYTYLSKRLFKKDQIDDLFQKILMKFHKSRKLYNPKYELLPWIYTISKNELLDYIKKKRINKVALNMDMEEKCNEISMTNIDIMKENSLTINEKEAIHLRYFNEDTFIEISKKLKTTESNVRKIISRGLGKLRYKYSGDRP